MRFGQLLILLAWKDVKQALQRNYSVAESELTEYQGVLAELLALEHCAQQLHRPSADTHIVVQRTMLPEVHPEPFVEVFGCAIDEADAEAGFSLSTTDWQQWLSMIIHPRSFDFFTRAEVVAHCLCEMTVYGFERSCAAAARDELEMLASELNGVDVSWAGE